MADASEYQDLIRQLEQLLRRYGGGAAGGGAAGGGAAGGGAAAAAGPGAAEALLGGLIANALPKGGPAELLNQVQAAGGCSSDTGDTLLTCCSRFVCVTSQCTTGGWC